MAENLPLAFNLLDKSSVQTCLNPLCFHASSTNPACIQCKMLSSATTTSTSSRKQAKCVCKSHSKSDAIGADAKTSTDQKKLNPTSNPTTTTTTNLNHTLTSLLKQNDTQTTANSYNVVSTRFDDPFHRRPCYFSHAKPAKSRRRVDNLNLAMSKTIQFKNSAGSINKDQVKVF